MLEKVTAERSGWGKKQVSKIFNEHKSTQLEQPACSAWLSACMKMYLNLTRPYVVIVFMYPNLQLIDLSILSCIGSIERVWPAYGESKVFASRVNRH